MDALQPDNTPSSRTIPTTTADTPAHELTARPATFTFPTLSLDGSLPDLADTPSKQYPPTPPAALSSLGAETKEMADHENLSETSLDAQYDMIDDLSELSTDDHDTASLVSTEHEHEEEGQLTPEESIVDLQEVQNREDAVTGGSDVAADNEILDSYMSEELETPRQSLLHNPDRSGPNASSSSPPQSDLAQLTTQNTRRVLFVSPSRVETVEVSDVCLQIASCLVSSEKSTVESVSRLVNLPLTANRSTPTSALLLRVADVELLVEPRTALPLQPDLSDTDFAIFYQNSVVSTAYPFVSAKRTVRRAGIPSILLASPESEYWMLQDTESHGSSLVLSNKALFPDDETKLRADLHRHLVKRQSIAEAEAEAKAKVKAEAKVDAEAKPFSLPDMCPLDGLYNDKGKFTWQEFALRLLPLIAILLAVIIKSSNVLDLIDGPPPNSNAAVDVRRDALSTVLAKMNSSPDATKIFNIDHLLPYSPEQTSSERLNINEVRFQGIPPNRILISLPAVLEDWVWMQPVQQFPTAASIDVYRSDKSIDFNQTRLLDGVYDITIPPDDAYGVVTVNMTTKAPTMHVYVVHDFGNRLLRRKTYEKAGMELSKAINKDVTVARKNVKSFGEKVGLELTAGATATKNVTSELAVYIARDLQILANTAISVFGKAAARSNETAATIKKELIVLQRELAVIRKDLIKLSQDVQKSVVATAQEAKKRLPAVKKTMQYPFALSKERAGKFRDLLKARRQGETTAAPLSGQGASSWSGKLRGVRTRAVPQPPAPPLQKREVVVEKKCANAKAKDAKVRKVEKEGCEAKKKVKARAKAARKEVKERKKAEQERKKAGGLLG